MRSTSARMRSASSRISTASSRSARPTLASSNCAAPRMPDSGFFTSCARIAAMPVTLRAALRNAELPVERARRRGVLQHQQHGARLLRQRRALHGDAALVQPRAVQRQVVVGRPSPRRCRTWSISRNSGLSAGRGRSAGAAPAARPRCRGTARRRGWRSGSGSRASSSTTGTGSAPSIGGGIGRRGAVAPRPTACSAAARATAAHAASASGSPARRPARLTPRAISGS